MTARRTAVAFRTLGCKVNQVESERIASELLGRGCAVVDERDADVVVVNTCTVTGEADRKARKEVRRALALPREPLVVVTGCLAALDAEGLRALDPERVVVEADKRVVATRVAERLGGGVAASGGAPSRPVFGRTRAQVLVEDGCDAYCAYCIVPYARGIPRAVPLADIEREVARLAAEGTREVVLTGINIGRYRGADGADLADVVRAVGRTGIERIRLSSVEPMHLPGRLLDALASTPAVCPHLHVPLQSGADRVLRAMDRAYDTAAYADVLRQARDAIPGLAVSTDVLTGFPGESPAEAVATREFVEECGFMRLHVFRYSRRRGTLAAEMPSQVDPRDKRSRSERLRELGDALASRYVAARLGGIAEVLVERVEAGMAEGTSEDYLRVRFETADATPGRIVPVRLEAAEAGYVLGRW